MPFKEEIIKRKVKGGFIGMNYYAAKAHNIPFHHHNKNVVEIWKTSKPVMKVTMHHEEIEFLLMKRGLNYHKAHSLALKYEEDPRTAKAIVKSLR